MTDRDRAVIGIDLDQKLLVIQVPLELLAFAAEQGPFQHNLDDPEQTPEADRFRVTDQLVFGKAIAEQIGAERGEDGTTFLHQMLDDAIEEAVELGEPGFVWPAIGIKGG